MQTLTVGVLADPGLPEKVVRRVAEELPRALSEHSGPDVLWKVEVSQETLPLTAEEEIALLGHARGLRDEHGWDCLVYLTDLPRSYDGDPLLCEVDAGDAAAMISLPTLASCVAAAGATGAFGIFYASIWNLSDTLPPVRLAMISVVVTGALSGWLIFHNSLWNRARDPEAPWRTRSDNASTVITVWLSVALMYLLLWSMLYLVGLAVIDAGCLESQLDHSIGLLDYVDLSWLAASLGTPAGALGSNFDSDEAIREATYSRREYQRRRLADTYDD